MRYGLNMHKGYWRKSDKYTREASKVIREKVYRILKESKRAMAKAKREQKNSRGKVDIQSIKRKKGRPSGAAAGACASPIKGKL